jgi:hypothetical protein
MYMIETALKFAKLEQRCFQGFNPGIGRWNPDFRLIRVEIAQILPITAKITQAFYNEHCIFRKH